MLRSVLVLLSFVLVAVPALAAGQKKSFTAHGIDFCEIGAVGNRAPTLEENPRSTLTGRNPGRVDYRYAIARTEVTVGQWQEFVNAYQPYYTGSPADTSFTGRGINWNPFTNTYNASTAALRNPTDMSFEYAARYCNWLHNGKVSAKWAFESGAYDTSTFGPRRPDGTYPHQMRRSEGAKFFMPTLDEWCKATYYDPDRYGPGEGGYWRFPGVQNTKPITGLPSEGGQTNTGSLANPLPLDVEAYANFQSPWGLLNCSGGEREYIELPADVLPSQMFGSLMQGSTWRISDSGGTDPFFPSSDLFGGNPGPSFPWAPGGGLRIATLVPSPGGLGLLFASVLLISRRRQPGAISPPARRRD
jgi:hypothetical protein